MIRKVLVLIAAVAAVVAVMLVPVSASSGNTFCQKGHPHTKTYCEKKCVVPELRGKTVSEARESLEKHDCRLGDVHRGKNHDVKPGRIFKSEPKAGSVRHEGFKVDVFVRAKHHHHHHH